MSQSGALDSRFLGSPGPHLLAQRSPKPHSDLHSGSFFGLCSSLHASNCAHPAVHVESPPTPLCCPSVFTSESEEPNPVSRVFTLFPSLLISRSPSILISTS